MIAQMIQLDFGIRFSLDCLPITLSSRHSERGVRRVARHLAQRLRLGRALRDKPTAIVHLHTCSGFSFHRSSWDMRVAQKHGCSTILHIHGAQFDAYLERAMPVERHFVRRALERADRVIALSRGWRDILLKAAPDSRIAVIENAVEIPSQRNPKPTGGPCRFLTLTRMDSWKGIDDLLDASTILNRRGMDFRLTLAGPEGSAGNAFQIRQKIEERGLSTRVEFAGPVVGAEKARLLASTDVYVQPSHNEGMPISILEAMAWALPVVATQVGAIPEIIDDDVHGLTIPPRNPMALAQAMGTLVADVPRRAALGNAGLALAATRFSQSRFREDLINLYDELLKPTASAESVRRAGRAAAIL